MYANGFQEVDMEVEVEVEAEGEVEADISVEGVHHHRTLIDLDLTRGPLYVVVLHLLDEAVGIGLHLLQPMFSLLPIEVDEVLPLILPNPLLLHIEENVDLFEVIVPLLLVEMTGLLLSVEMFLLLFLPTESTRGWERETQCPSIQMRDPEDIPNVVHIGKDHQEAVHHLHTMTRLEKIEAKRGFYTSRDFTCLSVCPLKEHFDLQVICKFCFFE